MPEVVNVSIMSGDVPVMGAKPASPTSRTETSCTLEIQLDPPFRAGRYEILAEALDTLMIEPRDADAETTIKSTWTPSQRVPIHVVDPSQ